MNNYNRDVLLLKIGNKINLEVVKVQVLEFNVYFFLRVCKELDFFQ